MDGFINFVLGCVVWWKLWCFTRQFNDITFRHSCAGIVATIFVASYRAELHLPRFRNAPALQKFGIIMAWVLVLAAIGLSDLHTWWGPLLQIGAFVAGLLVGRLFRGGVRAVPGTLLIILAVAILMLMQPEFFRFGQLGALTPVHLMFLILIAASVAATMALRMAHPRGRISNSIYVKLKWLTRIVAVLCMALFVLTESVPVFIGMVILFFISFAMSVWHSKDVLKHCDERMFAITLILFGVLTTMPVITALGILRWAALPREKAWEYLGRLL